MSSFPTFSPPFPDPANSLKAQLTNPRFKDGTHWFMSATDNLKPEYAIDGLKGYQTGRFTHAHSHIINRAKGDTFFVGIDTQLILKLFESKI